MKNPIPFAVLAAATLVAALDTTALAGKGEDKFNPDATYVATSGPYRLTGAATTIRVGLVQPAALAGMTVDAAAPCSGSVDLRIVDATNPSGPAIAESVGNAISPSAPAALEYVSPPGEDRTAYLVIVARQMDVDSRGCVLRGAKQQKSAEFAQVDVDKEVWRQDFGQVKADRRSDVLEK